MYFIIAAATLASHGDSYRPADVRLARLQGRIVKVHTRLVSMYGWHFTGSVPTPILWGPHPKKVYDRYHAITIGPAAAVSVGA